MTRTAMFTGLVFDEAAAPPSSLGGRNACCVVDDDGFLRHRRRTRRPAGVALLARSWRATRHTVSAMLDMMGQDDIFTKAAVDPPSTAWKRRSASLSGRGAALARHVGLSHRDRLQGNVVDIEMPAGGIDEGE